MAKKKKNYYEFITPLSIEECVNILNKPVKYGHFYGTRGKVRGNSFELGYSKSWQVNIGLVGDLTEVDGKTVLKCEYKFLRLFKIITTVLLSFFSLFTLFMYSWFFYLLVIKGESLNKQNDIFIIVLFPLGWLIYYFVYTKLLFIVSKKFSFPLIVEYLEQELQAIMVEK